MKTLKYSLSVLISAFMLLSLSSCEDKVEEKITYTANVPVYKSMADVLSGVRLTAPEELENTGKIYSYANLIYIAEAEKGVHVFDNSNPSNPVNIGFINIPGNKDIAIKDGFLYADCYTDLLVIKMNSARDYELINRVEGVFNYVIPEYNTKYPLAQIDESKGIVVGYTIEEVTTTKDYIVYHEAPYEVRMDNFDQTVRPSFGAVGESGGARSTGLSGGGEGLGGSFAQFMIVEDQLYVMNSTSEISFYDISSPAEPFENGSFSPGWEIETLHKYKENLFIGGRMGMYIYSVVDPANPTYLSEFNHADACDPVVADDRYAYVTLRTGTNCMGQLNQLEVIDIQNISNARHLKTVQMTNPHGVGIDRDNNVLFVCDGSAGLKVYDASELHLIESQHILQEIQGITAYDVIPLDGRLMLIAEDGLYQYDYNSNDKWLTMLSVINTAS